MEKASLICLHGPSACGKTRLLYAIEAALGKARTLRTGAEVIVRDLTDSLRDAGMDEFRRTYLEAETLLVDNLWVLDKKPATAAEVCRLLYERQKSGKLTVLASDIPVQDWSAKNSNVAQLLASGQSVRIG